MGHMVKFRYVRSILKQTLLQHRQAKYYVSLRLEKLEFQDCSLRELKRWQQRNNHYFFERIAEKKYQQTSIIFYDSDEETNFLQQLKESERVSKQKKWW